MTERRPVIDHPAIFSASSVLAIMADRKTQTRRVLRFPRAIADVEGGVLLTQFARLQDSYRAVFDFDGEPNTFAVRCPYGTPGSRLWVKETWQHWFWGNPGACAPGVRYKADGAMRWHPEANMFSDDAWRSPLLMPRWASRITLEITEIRCERLQHITKADCIAEGMEGLDDVYAGWHQSYAQLWDSLHGHDGMTWSADPYVWAISFRRVRAS